MLEKSLHSDRRLLTSQSEKRGKPNNMMIPHGIQLAQQDCLANFYAHNIAVACYLIIRNDELCYFLP